MIQVVLSDINLTLMIVMDTENGRQYRHKKNAILDQPFGCLADKFTKNTSKYKKNRIQFTG